MVAVTTSRSFAKRESETADVVFEEVSPEYPGLAELRESILRIQESRKRLLQLPEPMHGHFDVFPGGQLIYSHPRGGCEQCR